MTTTTYAVRSKTIDGKRVYYVAEERNPHVGQHSGYYSTRAKAQAAARQLAWGEQPEPGDC